MNIGWEWQSDLPNNQGRSKILKAIESAIKTIDPKYELVVDEATRNESGSVDIVSTILRKIDESNIFIADVIIGTRKKIHIQGEKWASRAFLKGFVEIGCQEELPQNPHWELR